MTRGPGPRRERLPGGPDQLADGQQELLGGASSAGGIGLEEEVIAGEGPCRKRTGDQRAPRCEVGCADEGIAFAAEGGDRAADFWADGVLVTLVERNVGAECRQHEGEQLWIGEDGGRDPIVAVAQGGNELAIGQRSEAWLGDRVDGWAGAGEDERARAGSAGGLQLAG